MTIKEYLILCFCVKGSIFSIRADDCYRLVWMVGSVVYYNGDPFYVLHQTGNFLVGYKLNWLGKILVL